MAGAGDWGRSMSLRGKAGVVGARRRKGRRGAPWGGCFEGMPKGGRSTGRGC